MYGVTKFTTRGEAIQRLVVEPIEASECIDDAWGEFEIEAIADEVIEAVAPERGDVFYRQREDVDHDRFWTIVAENEKEMV